MHAVTFDRYTTAAGLAVTDEPQPAVDPGQVLVRVGAASANAADWHIYRGDPYVMRLAPELRIKGRRTVCSDVAGVVEAVGPEVTGFAVGDRVFGEAHGAAAEFVAADADAIAHLPAKVPMTAAAATPMAGLTALQALRDTAGLRRGESVLVWGASGGVGHLAVQVARALGASRVDGVCSGANAAMVSGCGADRVYDYTAEQVAGARYDVIADIVTTASNRHLKRLLTPAGRVTWIGALGSGTLLGPITGLLKRRLGGALIGLTVRNALGTAVAADLDTLGAWLADGTIAPVIAGRYSLADAPVALARLEDGHVAGKLVIEVAALD